MEDYNDKDIQDQIITVLYENRLKGYLPKGQINKYLTKKLLKLSNKELEYHLRNLKDKKYIREYKNVIKPPVNKVKSDFSMVNLSGTFYEYEITPRGVEYIDSGFIETSSPRIPAIYIGGDVYFETINQTINYNIELKNLVNDEHLRQEIQEMFDELKQEMNQELINKNRIVQILKYIGNKVADKGLDKVMDLALLYITTFFK